MPLKAGRSIRDNCDLDNVFPYEEGKHVENVYPS